MTTPQPGSPVTFSYNAQHFLIDGKPLQIFCGELHYFRVPRPYWRDRLLKAKALGLNAICTYMPWNLHEPRPGVFDFEGDQGMLDVAAFVRMAADVGLWVLLRPGPYICAEWDFGGLPGWLLADADVRIRCADPKYLAAVDQFMTAVGRELAPLTCPRGGPIVMVQVENEYGSYANDKVYLRHLKNTLTRVGLGGEGIVHFTSDGPQPDMLAAGTLDDCLAVANFGSKSEQNLGLLKKFRPNQPVMCGEFWCGWFDQWGKNRQGNADPTVAANEIRWMVDNNASFSIYMFHGGTNFGFTAGANHYEAYAPTVTGYDYWALLDEAGRPTPKYHAVREILSAHNRALPDLPPSRPTSSLPNIRWAHSASLMKHLPAPISDAMVRPMEHYGQYGGGAILYRSSIKGLGAGKLTVVEPHDYAIIYLDGVKVGTLDRKEKQWSIELPEGDRLEILAWALGRTNYGPKMLDRKGITERVEFKHLTLTGWDIFPLSLDSEQLSRLRFSHEDVVGPAFHRGTFEMNADALADTFIDCRSASQGCVWVNGHNLGRFWRVGPQQTLYCPGCWLQAGENEIVVFDLEGAGRPNLAGLAEPILDEVPATA